ncbi:AKR1 [Symbiodinium sp. CCMP2456]|nr:AKR1 [Symbiodinium sp. CCMP2456]
MQVWFNPCILPEPEVETEPQATEKPRALQGHGLFVSKELGQKLAMLEHEETPPDSPGDLHGRLDEKSALALLRGRADPNATLGALQRTPLFAAAERCNIKLIDNLLKFRADVNRADLAGETPLFALCHAAAWADASLRSRRAAVQRLLEGEADIDFANPRGRTPLHAAITSGDVAVLSVLLEDTANVNARDLGGFTALMWAAGRGNAEVVKALLTARANTALAANRALLGFSETDAAYSSSRTAFRTSRFVHPPGPFSLQRKATRNGNSQAMPGPRSKLHLVLKRRADAYGS